MKKFNVSIICILITDLGLYIRDKLKNSNHDLI